MVNIGRREENWKINLHSFDMFDSFVFIFDLFVDWLAFDVGCVPWVINELDKYNKYFWLQYLTNSTLINQFKKNKSVIDLTLYLVLYIILFSFPYHKNNQVSIK